MVMYPTKARRFPARVAFNRDKTVEVQIDYHITQAIIKRVGLNSRWLYDGLDGWKLCQEGGGKLSRHRDKDPISKYHIIQKFDRHVPGGSLTRDDYFLELSPKWSRFRVLGLLDKLNLRPTKKK